MAETTLENVYRLNGYLLNINSPRSGSIVASNFDPEASGQIIVDDLDSQYDWDLGETATFDGLSASLVGTGMMSAGVTLLGLPIELGSAVPVNVFTSNGATYFHYPEENQSYLLDGLLSAVLATPAIGATLSLLGLNSLTLIGYLEQNAVLTYDISPGASIFLCFTAGTLIQTAEGQRPIEDLRVGDLVETLDNGAQPIRWIGRRRLLARGNLAPVRITAGAMGNRRMMEVSPQHRMLVTSTVAELLFGENEVLVPAIHLVDGQSIIRRVGGTVDYIHLLFDRHEILFAEGIPSESFHPGLSSLDALSRKASEEVYRIFPQLRPGQGGVMQCARRSLRQFEALALLGQRPADPIGAM